MIYQKLYNAIEAILQTVGSVKTVDWFNDQYTNTEEENAKGYPAAYIDLTTPTGWSDASQGMQVGDMYITIHVVEFSLREKPAVVLPIANAVYKALHRKPLFDGSDQLTTDLVRSGTELVRRSTNLKVFKIEFNTHVFDIEALDQAASTIAPGTVNGTPNFNITP